jgi:hypothetical protein
MAPVVRNILKPVAIPKTAGPMLRPFLSAPLFWGLQAKAQISGQRCN